MNPFTNSYFDEASLYSSPLTRFGSGRAVLRIIDGGTNKIYGSLGSLAGMPGRCGLFKVDTTGPTVTVVMDNANECGLPALLKDSTDIYAVSSPNGLALKCDTNDLITSIGHISTWLGGATDVLINGRYAYVLRFVASLNPPVPFLTSINLDNFRMTQYEFPLDTTDINAALVPLSMVIYDDIIYIGTSVTPMLLSFDTTKNEFTLINRLSFYDSAITKLSTAIGNVRCMAANSSNGDIWGVVSGDPTRPPYIFKYTNAGVLTKEAVFDEAYTGSDVYSMTMSYADTTTTLYMALRKASDVFCGAEIVKWDSTQTWAAPWANTNNIYGEKAITALYEDATYIYAGTAPNAILFKVQKSNSTITKIYTFGPGGSI